MTQHFNLPKPRFYVTENQPCPYIEGRRERKIFTPLHGRSSAELHDILTLAGFRRSQNVAYRPDCAGCDACVSTRILVDDFAPSRTQRRIAARNNRLTRAIREPVATDEHYDLFRRYLRARHEDGAMSEMDALDFASMIEDTTVRSHIVEYRDPESDALIAACLTDALRDGVSLVYSFFDPDRVRDSLGGYVILDHIEIAREFGLPHVYLGYWIAGSRKMAYKAAYQPLEGLIKGEWRRLGDS